VLKNVWVGPDGERTLEEAWKAYRPPTLTAADYAYWKKCEDRGAEVRYVPWLYELQTTFAERTRDLALRNMEKNGVFIRNEAKRLGLGVDGAAVGHRVAAGRRPEDDRDRHLRPGRATLRTAAAGRGDGQL